MKLRALSIGLFSCLGLVAWSFVQLGVFKSPPSARAAMSALLPSLASTSLEERRQALGIEPGAPIFIRIFKQSAELELWMGTETGTYLRVKTYPICAFSGTLGPKLKEGDRQSPEGFYRVDQNALLPTSQFHRAFNLGFPNEYDRAHGRTGSYLMVHGACVSIGCYAMTNAGIDEIYSASAAALKNGQPAFQVHIFPFPMSNENMEAHSTSANVSFWKNLKEGYDLFEEERRPPFVSVADKAYQFTNS